MHVANVDEVEECELSVEGARGVKVKYLLHEGVGAERLQLRLFIIDVGGHTPVERHKHEHEVFVLRGKAHLQGEDTEVIVGEGDAIFIPSWEKHQFKNIGEGELQFLCTKDTVPSENPQKKNREENKVENHRRKASVKNATRRMRIAEGGNLP